MKVFRIGIFAVGFFETGTLVRPDTTYNNILDAVDAVWEIEQELPHLKDKLCITVSSE